MKIFRFGITGMVGLIVDFGVTYICKEQLKWNKYLSNSWGFSLAVINNYYLNRIWTFKSQDPHIGRQFLSFLGISMVGLALNNGILLFFHGKKLKNFYWSKLMAVGIVFIWNFTANSLITFKHV